MCYLVLGKIIDMPMLLYDNLYMCTYINAFVSEVLSKTRGTNQGGKVTTNF